MTVITDPSSLVTRQPWKVCGMCVDQWYKLRRRGKTPPSILMGVRLHAYLLTELEAWLKAGSPDRKTWIMTRPPEFQTSGR